MTAETALLQEISEGNEKAFQMLFESKKGKLHTYLFHITKSKEISEEILIDVFLKIWLLRDMIQEIQCIDAFLHKLAYNKAMDFFKITSRNANLQKLVHWDSMAAKEKQVDHQLLDHDYKIMLANALEQLSPQRRTIFNLSRTEGLSYGQIANHMQITRHTVRNTMTETLKSIRK